MNEVRATMRPPATTALDLMGVIRRAAGLFSVQPVRERPLSKAAIEICTVVEAPVQTYTAIQQFICNLLMQISPSLSC